VITAGFPSVQTLTILRCVNRQPSARLTRALNPAGNSDGRAADPLVRRPATEP
jgi:hypothetical protein